MKASEYGGSDTTKTLGIQPFPHVLTAEERLRLLYKQEATEEEWTAPPELDPASSTQ